MHFSVTGRVYYFLPPTSEEWGEVLFSVCQFTPRPGERGGYPIPGLGGGGYPIPGPGAGGTLSYVQVGVPHSRSRWGVPQSRWGYPSHPGLDGATASPGAPAIQDWIAYLPSRIGWGTPHPGLYGVPPVQEWMGYPLPHQEISIASTYYAAGGVPLVI